MDRLFLKRKFNLKRVIIGVVILLIIFFIFEYSHKIINFGLIFFQNFSVEYVQRAGSFFRDLFLFPRLRKEYYLLKEENLRLKELEKEYFLKKEENETLKKALLFKEEGLKTVSSRILFIDPSPLPSYFWIDKGLKDGIQPDMNVISPQKILIGKIIHCFDDFCQGEFVFSPLKKISVEVLEKNIKGIAFRDKNGAFLLSYILKDVNIENGDIVISSGGSYFLKDFLLGKVKHQKTEGEKGGYTEFYLDPLVDYSTIKNVLVIVTPF